MNLILASPTYGPVQPQAVRAIRMAVMHAAAAGVTWVGESSPDKTPIIDARNAAVELAKATDAMGIMWIDDDMVPPQDAITKLLSRRKPFVSGLYYNRRAPHQPLAGYWDADMFRSLHVTPGNGLVPVDCAGFGFMFTHTDLLGRFGRFGDGPHAGEDLFFCREAMLRTPRVQLLVDTNLVIGHLSDPGVINGPA